MLGSGLLCLNYDEVNCVCMYVHVFTCVCVCVSQHRKDLCSLTLWVTLICGGWRGKAEGKDTRLQYRVSAAHSEPQVLTSFHEQSASSVPQAVSVLSGIGPQSIRGLPCKGDCDGMLDMGDTWPRPFILPCCSD